MDWFMNPALLTGMSLAAVPIILHLIMRQKPRKLVFPAMQFLRTRHQANTRRLQLKHLLLLALRILLICLMAAALARPRLSAGSGLLADQAAPVTAMFVFDTSPRMRYTQNETRLEAAKTIAQGLLAKLPTESEVAVLDSKVGQPMFQVDPLLTQGRIQRLDTTTTAQPLARVIEQAIETLTKAPNSADQPRRKELYVFTDLAAQAWSPAALAPLKEQLARTKELALYVIDVGIDEPQNFALGDVRLSNQVVARNSPLDLRIEVRRVGPAAPRGVEFFLLDREGQPDKRGEQTVELTGGDSQLLEFPLSNLEEGTAQGYVQLVGSDALDVDDKRWFTVEVKPAWKVLIASTTLRDAVNLEQALSPDRLRARNLARYSCDVIRFNKLTETPLIEKYAVVCLVDPPPLESAIWVHLRDFVNQGGGLAIFLGPSARSDPAGFNAPEPQVLLPGKLGIESRRLQGDLALAPDPRSHPMLAKFTPLEGKIPWQLLKVFRYWSLEELKASAQVVAPFSNQQPAIVELPVGRGRVMTMTTPVSELPDDPSPWNYFGRYPEFPFIMLVDQMSLYLAGSIEEKLNYACGQAGVIRLPRDLPATPLVVTLPDGEKRSANSNPKLPNLTIPFTDLPGNYAITGNAGDMPLKYGFSANIPALASDLARTTPADIKTALGDFPVQIARKPEELSRLQDLGRVGRELFPYLMVFLVIFMAIEALLANRFYQEQPGNVPGGAGGGPRPEARGATAKA